MQRVNRRLPFAALLVPASLFLASGCGASKAYVDMKVATVNNRVDALEKKETADILDVIERIDGVDVRAKAGISAAGTAQAAAQAADNKAAAADSIARNAQQAANAADTRAASAASAAGTADTKAGNAQSTATDAQGRANTAQNSANTAQTGVNENRVEIANLNKKVDGIVIPGTQTVSAAAFNIDTIDSYAQSGAIRQVNFAFDKSDLSADAKKTLDALFDEVKGQDSGFMLELKGYTDSIGSENYNIGLSERRVMAVQRYLVAKGVALSRLSIIGLGKDNPVADNKTSAGQAQNRRVDIRLLRAQNNSPRR